MNKRKSKKEFKKIITMSKKLIDGATIDEFSHTADVHDEYIHMKFNKDNNSYMINILHNHRDDSVVCYKNYIEIYENANQIKKFYYNTNRNAVKIFVKKTKEETKMPNKK